MRDQLAERVLATIMGWETEQIAESGSLLQTLARHKYDSYEGYRPGVKFLENLAGWLDQFDDVNDRRTAVGFVMGDLVFVSRAELDHLVEKVYPDSIRPMLIREAAAALGESRFAISRVTSSPIFAKIQRKLLVLGLSDGARVDRLRRSSPGLSHEQIYLATDIGDDTADDAVRKLRRVVADDTATFEHVLLVDDFYGSGKTLLRDGPTPGSFDGRLWRARNRLEELHKEHGVVAEDCRVSVLAYLASSTAVNYVESKLAAAGLNWEFEVIQTLPDSLRVEDPAMVDLCNRYWDPVLEDEHKGAAALGYGGAALPLVLYHNSPNNSICLVWADSTDRTDGNNRRALFPRYERHHISRP